MAKMNIKKGDTVKVLAGKDRGKTGKIVRTLPNVEKVVVEGVNLVTKHLRPRKSGGKGQRVQFPAAMPVGKVILVCPKCDATTRVGHEVTAEGSYRVCKRCQSQI